MSRLQTIELLSALVVVANTACETRVAYVDCTSEPRAAGCSPKDASVHAGTMSEDNNAQEAVADARDDLARADTAVSAGGPADAGAKTGAIDDSASSDGGFSCLSDADCGTNKPQCDRRGRCVECTTDRACDARGAFTRCQLGPGDTQGQCVQCLSHTDCADTETPFCAQNTCEECKEDSDCPAGAPLCTDGVCGPCANDNPCSGRAGKGHCVTAEGDAQQGECVACTHDAHCENPKPECTTDHVCDACASNDACAPRPGRGVCDLSNDATYGGTCVQCTGTQYASCTQGTLKLVCDSAMRTCSASIVERTATSCQPCISDAQCQDGKLCVPQRFDDPFDNPDLGVLAEIGHFCGWRADAANGPNGSCYSVRPYVERSIATSIDGTIAEVCTPHFASCTALEDIIRSKDCKSPQGTGDDSLCGTPGVPDGYCVQVGPSTFHCTTACGVDADCDPLLKCTPATTNHTPDTCQ